MTGRSAADDEEAFMSQLSKDPWILLSRCLHSDQLAVRTARRDLTFRDLDRATAELSRRLGANIRAQSGVGVLLGMLPEYLVADLAILRSNFIKVPLNPMLSGPAMAEILEHSEARVLLTSDRLPGESLADVARIRELLPDLLVVDVSLDELLGDFQTMDCPVVEARPEDRAAIYYTGGTTGEPKGVVHSRAGVAATILAHALEADIGSSDTLLLSTSLSHSAGAFAQASIMRGATLVLLDRYSPDEFCRTAAEENVTWAMVVPTMLYRLLDYVKERPERRPALRTIVYGSAPITPSRLQEAIEEFGPIFVQLFGQTECPNWGTSLGKRDHARALTESALLSSCGAPCALAEVRIVDDEGLELPAGMSGEIVITAPYQMIEYWRNEEATAATLIDGWVHTRDIGQRDENGYFYVLDRKTDMIISGGYNVYSSEVEAALQRIDGVAQVAVIGIPDTDWGEAVCAIIVRSGAVELDESAVLTAARKLLGAYKRPKHVVFVDEIPLTPFGKADKKRLRTPFWHGAQRAI